MLRGSIIVLGFVFSFYSNAQLVISPVAGGHYSFSSLLDGNGKGEWNSNNLAFQAGIAIQDQFHVWADIMQMNNVAYNGKSSNNTVLVNNYGVSYRFLPTEKIASGTVILSGGFGLNSSIADREINQEYTLLDTANNYYVYNGTFRKFKDQVRIGFKADVYYKGFQALVGPTYGLAHIGRSFTDVMTGETTEFNDLVKGWNLEFTIQYRFESKKAKSRREEDEDENDEDQVLLRL